MAEKKRILAVDDENDVLLILRTALAEDYDVQTASSGPEALAIVAEKQPDLIILDYMMPEMNGLEVLDKLKDADETAAIPVIFLTGVSDRSTIREALGKGTAYYLVKPFEMADLLSKVELALRDAAV